MKVAGGLWGFQETTCLFQKQGVFVNCYIRYPFSEGTVPLGQIWAGYPHTGHRVLVGVGRINMAVLNHMLVCCSAGYRKYAPVLMFSEREA